MYKAPVFQRSVLTTACCLALAACGAGSGDTAATRTASEMAAAQPDQTSAATAANPAAYNPGVASLKALAAFPVGVAVDGGWEARSLVSTPAEQQVVNQHFSQVTPGNIMKMSYLHPDKDTYTFAQADELVNYAAAHDVRVHAHALIWHSDYQVPTFMKNFSGDKTAFLAMLDEHVKTIATHYAGKVQSWDVVNEALNDGGGYRQSLFYRRTGADYLDRAFRAAREADPNATLYYNDYNIESDANKMNTLTSMLDGFKARGVPIDGVGFQMHVYMDWPSTNQIKASLQKVVDRGLKVKISELDIPINNPYSPAYQAGDIKTVYTLDLGLAQKKRYCEVVKAYLDVVPPAQRGGIVVWGESDPSSWLIQQLFQRKHDDWPLLFDGQYQGKPALRGVADALTGQACTNLAFVDATSSVKIARSGVTLNRVTAKSTGSVTFTNTTNVTLNGPLQFRLDGLTAGVSLDNVSGAQNGAPYMTLPVISLAPGASVSVTTTFSNPGKVAVGYTATLISGSF
jgi:endo-1,4-beta-xylanase